MKKLVNDCVSCDLPCLGSACSLRNRVTWICDRCESEVGVDCDALYEYDGEQLCGECVLESLDKVKTD
jgi:hypothetical protein